MTYEMLKRNKYGSNGAHDGSHHQFDLDNFHLPSDRLYHAHANDWGVVQGLEVGWAPGQSLLSIQEGIAIDHSGMIIPLSSAGKAKVVMQDGNITVVSGFPVNFPLGTRTGIYYLTVEHDEYTDLNVPARQEWSISRPKLRLQPVSGAGAYQNNGDSIILAVVDIQDGKLIDVRTDESGGFGRRLIGRTVGELRIQQSSSANNTVGQILAGTIGPGEGESLVIDGGLKVDGEIQFADGASAHAALDVRGHLLIESGGNPWIFGGLGDAELNRYLFLVNSPTKTTALGLKAGSMLISDNYANANPDRGDLVVMGKVGIGTPQPETTLHVQGTILATPADRGIWGVHDQFIAATEAYHADGSHSNRELRIQSADTTETDSSGNHAWGAHNQYVVYGGRITAISPNASGNQLTITQGKYGVFSGIEFDQNGNISFLAKTGYGPQHNEQPNVTPERSVTIGADGVLRYVRPPQMQSSREFKEGIEDLSSASALAVLDGLMPVTFRRKADPESTLALGFIAEDAPDSVTSRDHKAVITDHIVAVLSRVVKDQQQSLLELRLKLSAMEARERLSDIR